MSHEEQAKALFMDGCNCAQAAFCAFCDVTGLEKELAMRLSSSFGGGMGRLREVCGALSGIFMAAGILYGYDDLTDKSLKTDHYERIQELAARFRKENGSILCREILGLEEEHSKPEPEDRNPDYYARRPCPEVVARAARIFEEYMREHPIPER
ncbi:MAG: C_GCAxxG_C_C family protein [Lachnospiraceae bacterium]|nr:C_GCAxxG_C_C family protein [Lachnospiraceae bacterium]